MTPREVIARTLDGVVWIPSAFSATDSSVAGNLERKRKMSLQKADTILAALGATGMAVVPVEATQAMADAGGAELDRQLCEFQREETGSIWDAAPDVWRLMIAAAQAPGDG